MSTSANTSPIASSQTTTVPAVTDWLAITKTVCIEIVFVASAFDVLFLHDTDPAVINVVISTGVALGVLRVSDIVANIVNVKSFLSKPDSGVVPQAVGTPLITGTQNGSQTTINPGGAPSA